jgi:endonuclease-3
MSRPPSGTPRKARRKADPIKPWARRLLRSRPGLVEFVLDRVNASYGEPVWQRVHDPTSELVLTILSQNSADTNAEKAFEALREAYPGHPSDPGANGGDGPGAAARAAADGAAGAAGPAAGAGAAAVGSAAVGPAAAVRTSRPGWGGAGLAQAAAPDWLAVEMAPPDELVAVIRPGGLAPQKGPRIQAALQRLRETNGDHSLEFLGHVEALAARDWLTAIDGVGVKTASVVLMMSFGMPLMPVDRHVDRVSKRIGLMPPKVSAEEAHDRYLALLDAAQCYPMHVGLITHGRRTCHARLPDCDDCPIAPRCRFVDRRAP